jgi:hypothetical protein
MFLQTRRALIPVMMISGIFTPDTPEPRPARPILSVEGFIFVRGLLIRAALALSPARKFNEPTLN